MPAAYTFLRIPLFPVLLDQSSEKADLDCQTKTYHHKMSMAKQNVIPTKPEFRIPKKDSKNK